MCEQYARTQKVLGPSAIKVLAGCRVAVFGLGGVGGAVVEALARGGIGSLDLIDRDHIEVSNINRQLAATWKTVGLLKTEVMKERIHQINPMCRVKTHDIFYLPENADLIDLSQYDYIVDAIDTVTAKIELIMRANQAHVPVISSMGTGNRLDPSAFKIMDLYETKTDPLAKVMRRELKKRGVRELKVVCSSETPVKPICNPGEERTPGSVSFVPPAAGLVIAGAVILDLAGEKDL